MFTIVNCTGLIINKRTTVPRIFSAIDTAYRAGKLIVFKNVQTSDGVCSPGIAIVRPAKDKYKITFAGHDFVVNAKDVITPALDDRKNKQTNTKEVNINES